MSASHSAFPTGTLTRVILVAVFGEAFPDDLHDVVGDTLRGGVRRMEPKHLAAT